MHLRMTKPILSIIAALVLTACTSNDFSGAHTWIHLSALYGATAPRANAGLGLT